MNAAVAPTGATGPVIDVRGLRMRYGSTDVLQGLNLTVRRGEVVALLGPNGAGKTTTIEILEGFRRRSAGEVSVLGVDPERGGERWRARLGIVLQSWRDHGRWRVRELLDHLAGYYEPFSRDRSSPYEPSELLDVVGLTEHGAKRVAQLSGGQRRRLDVALGLVGRPELLFLDEPTVGFDLEARRDFHDLVHRLCDLEATTIMLTTHDLAEADKLADRICILAEGRIEADGSADALAREIAGHSEVRWRSGGQRFVHSTREATAFVRELLAGDTDHRVSDLEVRGASLEDTYLAMVARAEPGAGRTPPLTLVEAG